MQLWFGGHGVFKLWSLNRDITQEQNNNDSLMQRNERLHAEVKELKEGKEALEERARSQLGFIREGEKFYRVIPQKNSKTP